MYTAYIFGRGIRVLNVFLKRKLFDSSSQAHRRIVSWDADIVATDGSDHS